jgi:hypothetical protein
MMILSLMIYKLKPAGVSLGVAAFSLSALSLTGRVLIPYGIERPKFPEKAGGRFSFSGKRRR